MGKKKFKVDQTNIRDLLDRYKIAIPDFQREYVWKQNKRKLLLKSLFNGFPIGALTLYKNDNNGYYIIDGLQRLNTLKLYYKEPSSIIAFDEYYDMVSEHLKEWVKDNCQNCNFVELQNTIKKWYNELDEQYKFEKFSFFIKCIKGNSKIGVDVENIEKMESLLDILNNKILIEYDAVPLIEYEGDKDDLPELFKNINTGSMCLTKYEVFQSIWIDYKLDKKVLNREYECYGKVFELKDKTYEIDNNAKRTVQFDMFKNLISLSYEICCIKEADCLFKNFKKIKDSQDDRYFNDRDIAFEIYSTLICKTSNKIDKAVSLIFNKKNNNTSKDTISKFIKKLNSIIIDEINDAISVIKKNNIELIDSNYHSLYLLYGFILSKYVINYEQLSIQKREKVKTDVYDQCLYFEKDWFIDKNRQISFFVGKIKEYDKLM